MKNAAELNFRVWAFFPTIVSSSNGSETEPEGSLSQMHFLQSVHMPFLGKHLRHSPLPQIRPLGAAGFRDGDKEVIRHPIQNSGLTTVYGTKESKPTGILKLLRCPV
jgi:hypothetical protein